MMDILSGLLVKKLPQKLSVGISSISTKNSFAQLPTFQFTLNNTDLKAFFQCNSSAL